MSFDSEEFDNFLLEHGCVGFFDPPITLKSGRPGYYYINVRNLVSTSGLKEDTVRYVYEFAMDNGLKPDYFLGVPEGATPLGLAVTDMIGYRNRYEVPSVMLRAVPKDHGDPKDRFSVGKLEPNSHTVVIEDVTTTGGSMLDTVANLQEANIIIDAVIAVANRLERRDDGRTVRGALEQDYGIKKYLAMTNSIRLVPKAYEQQQPGKKVAEAVENYFKEYGATELKLL